MFSLTIITPLRRVVGPIPVKSLNIVGSKGEVTILPGHAHLISSLDTGIFRFERENGEIGSGAISFGFLEVKEGEATVLAETLELSQEIDIERAKIARERAAEKIKAKVTFDQEMLKWQRKLQRASIRLQAANYLLPPH